MRVITMTMLEGNRSKVGVGTTKGHHKQPAEVRFHCRWEARMLSVPSGWTHVQGVSSRKTSLSE